MARRCESWHGAAAQGKDSFELVAVSANVLAGQGVACPGGAGQGSAGIGKDYFELVAVTRMSGRGPAGHGITGRGMAGLGLFELVA